MRLPFAEQATIEPPKLADYLLDAKHPDGASKAVFFLGLGFRRDEPEHLARALLRAAGTTEMQETRTAHGLKYAGIGTIIAPNGR
jgi:hypothetical protein